jgi:hypothetical protein
MIGRAGRQGQDNVVSGLNFVVWIMWELMHFTNS